MFFRSCIDGQWLSSVFAWSLPYSQSWRKVGRLSYCCFARFFFFLWLIGFSCFQIASCRGMRQEHRNREHFPVYALQQVSSRIENVNDFTGILQVSSLSTIVILITLKTSFRTNDFWIAQFIGFKVDVKKQARPAVWLLASHALIVLFQVGGSFFFVCHATKSRDLHVARWFVCTMFRFIWSPSSVF